ncbi:Two-component transcriptional response regulator, LuxR family [hydrothermal vent metagenome]|uniref:Two-component transcriptional response regulator, LuxR family n=1 Tax=hydrothermal vent metagenome TaxID=652676 RepID=A0A3B0XD36_9ZZZZ
MKILLADDHPLVRAGVKLLLNRLCENSEIVEAKNYSETLEVCKNCDDLMLVLLDRMMPGVEEFGDLNAMIKVIPDVPIVIMSASEDPAFVRQSLGNGAKGYLPKALSEDVMQNALQLVLAGGVYLPPSLLEESEKKSAGASPMAINSLTSRQKEVLDCISIGKSNKQIATFLKISEATVHTHVNAIFRALNVRNRTEAVHVAKSESSEIF